MIHLQNEYYLIVIPTKNIFVDIILFRFWILVPYTRLWQLHIYIYIHIYFFYIKGIWFFVNNKNDPKNLNIKGMSLIATHIRIDESIMFRSLHSHNFSIDDQFFFLLSIMFSRPHTHAIIFPMVNLSTINYRIRWPKKKGHHHSLPSYLIL
jgi:hypothetical protein